MNLQELDEFIAAIPKDDTEMIEYYRNKRAALVEEIQTAIDTILSTEVSTDA